MHVAVEEEHPYVENHPDESIAQRLSRLEIFLGRLHHRSQRAFDELVKTNQKRSLR